MRRAIILAGGLGTRLQPYTVVLPKPLMPVGDRPVLDIVVRQLKHQGFDRITISTGHLAELIEAFFRDGEAYGIPIDYVREHEPLGTVGALALIDGLDEDFLVMNGDVLTDMNFSETLEAHSGNDAVATVASRLHPLQVSLGVMEFHEDDPTKLRDYIEKPELSYVVSMGVYCFSPKVLDYIEAGKRLDFPELMLRLVEAGETVRQLPSDAYWKDIGRPGDYEGAQDDFKELQTRLLPEGG
ncbi:MAG TPA: sugar phosphate nucleotidyltransferase [Thermoleophilaceae bacterium]